MSSYVTTMACACAWLFVVSWRGRVWIRGRARVPTPRGACCGGARFPCLTAVARVGGALFVRRERARARRSSLTLLVSSAGVSVFVVWRGEARARPVALSLVTLATTALSLAPGCHRVRCGARASLAVAWLLWDRRSRLGDKRGVAAPAGGRRSHSRVRRARRSLGRRFLP